MRLMKPLGDWLIPANNSKRLWPFYYSEDTAILYRSYRKKWEKNRYFYYNCHKIADNDTYNYKPDGNVETLPIDASPTDVMDTEEGWRISNHQPVRNKEEKQESIGNKTLLQHIMLCTKLLFTKRQENYPVTRNDLSLAFIVDEL